MLTATGLGFHTFGPCWFPEGSWHRLMVSAFGSSVVEFSTSSLSPKRVGKVGDGCQRSEVTPAHWSSGLQAHLLGCLSGLLVGRGRDSLSCPRRGGLEAGYQGRCLP